MQLFILLLLSLLYSNESFLAGTKLVRMQERRGRASVLLMQIEVMVNGMPGPMAVETAKACIDKGFKLLPYGFTGKNQPEELDVQGVKVKLIEGASFGPKASEVLKKLKAEHPKLIVVDYTHPSAILSNLQAYADNDCDFVMGTTGGDMEQMTAIQAKSKSAIAVIAPNMAKQIVAVQATLQSMAERFPNSFVSYGLTVTESHQSSKADTSGTAKAIVKHLATLNGAGDSFTLEDIVKVRDEESQLKFGVPASALSGHAFHTYRLTSKDGSVTFELQHNVCGRRVYAEGTADAVAFVASARESQGGSKKRLFNMIDVLEAGAMR